MSSPSSNSDPSQNNSKNHSSVRVRGRVPHGLEDVEKLIATYMRAHHSGAVVWTAEKNQLDALFQWIRTGGGQFVEKDGARIDYKYEISTCLMHIYLVGEDVHHNKLTDSEMRMRSFFVDLGNISDPRILITQHEQMIYNEDALEWLRLNNVPFNHLEFQDSIDGTEILYFQHGGIPFNSTTRCMDAGNSKWTKKHSHLHLFNQVTAGKISGVPHDVVLSIALVHPDNENIIGVPAKYKDGTAIIVDARHKYTMERVPFHREGMPNVTLPRIKTRRFESLEAVQAELNAINAQIVKSKQLDFEGFIIRVYRDPERRFLWKLLKLQTKVFRAIKAIRPNTGSRNEMVLELYLRGNLTEYSKWCRVNEDAKRVVFDAFKSIVREMHAVYAMTRNHRNSNLYNSLPESWKRMLFDIHYIFLEQLKAQKIAVIVAAEKRKKEEEEEEAKKAAVVEKEASSATLLTTPSLTEDEKKNADGDNASSSGEESPKRVVADSESNDDSDNAASAVSLSSSPSSQNVAIEDKAVVVNNDDKVKAKAKKENEEKAAKKKKRLEEEEEEAKKPIEITYKNVEAHIRSQPLRAVVNVLIDRTGIIQSMINMHAMKQVRTIEPFMTRSKPLETLIANLLAENSDSSKKDSRRGSRFSSSSGNDNYNNEQHHHNAGGKSTQHKNNKKKSTNSGYSVMDEEEAEELRRLHAPSSARNYSEANGNLEEMMASHM